MHAPANTPAAFFFHDLEAKLLSVQNAMPDDIVRIDTQDGQHTVRSQDLRLDAEAGALFYCDKNPEAFVDTFCVVPLSSITKIHFPRADVPSSEYVLDFVLKALLFLFLVSPFLLVFYVLFSFFDAITGR